MNASDFSFVDKGDNSSPYSQFDTSNTKSVVVQSVAVRDRPSFLGKVLATANYKDSVNLISQHSSWSQVIFGNVNGYIPTSAITKPIIQLNFGNPGVTPWSNVGQSAGKG